MRTLSSNNQTEAAGQVTRPVWLVEIQFAIFLRLSSREEITIDGDVFLASNLDIDIAAKRLRLFNEALQWSATFLAGTSGVRVRIWKVWGESPFAAADLDLWFDGELGGGTVGTTIEFRLLDNRPRQCPRIYAAPPTFNHLPPDGTEIVTPTGTRLLKRA